MQESTSKAPSIVVVLTGFSPIFILGSFRIKLYSSIAIAESPASLSLCANILLCVTWVSSQRFLLTIYALYENKPKKIIIIFSLFELNDDDTIIYEFYCSRKFKSKGVYLEGKLLRIRFNLQRRFFRI